MLALFIVPYCIRDSVSHVHVIQIQFYRLGEGGGGTMYRRLAKLCSEFDNKNIMSWYSYVLCPGTTMCYVLVPLCVVGNRPPTFKHVNLQANPHKQTSNSVGTVYM